MKKSDDCKLTPSFSMLVGGYEGGAHDEVVPDISRRVDLADKKYQGFQSRLPIKRTTLKRIEMRLKCSITMYITLQKI